MSVHATLILLRTDGTELIERDKPYKGVWEPGDEFFRGYIRDGETFNRRTCGFLGYCEGETPWYRRGVPVGLLNEGQLNDMSLDDDVTWFTLEEALALDWDAPFNPDSHSTGSRREVLGEYFIAWLEYLKAEGVIIIVAGFG